MLYLLDTDTCVFLVNRRPGYETVLDRMDGMRYGQVLISAVTLCELEFGVANSARRDHNRRRVELFLARLATAPLDEAAARHYGEIRAALERKGRPIGPLDTLIAAHAVALGAVLVTNNVREFSRIPSLRIKNWMKSTP